MLQEKFTPRKFLNRSLYVMDKAYKTYFVNKELETDSVGVFITNNSYPKKFKNIKG